MGNKYANGRTSGTVGDGVVTSAILLPFEDPDYRRIRPPVSREDIEKIAQNIPAELISKLDSKELERYAEAIGRYIYETYGVDSGLDISQIVVQDPLLNHAFGVAHWVIPQTRIFENSETNAAKRANIVDQQQRQKAKVEVAITFVDRLPRLPDIGKHISSELDIQDQKKILNDLFGDPNTSRPASGTFNVHRAVNLVERLLRDHCLQSVERAIEIVEGIATTRKTGSWKSKDYPESTLMEYANVASRGLMSKQVDAETFEDIFALEETPFEYRKGIASKFPVTIKDSEGKGWVLTLPESPAELSRHGAQMDNCTGKVKYISDIKDGDTLIVIARPEHPDPEVDISRQTVNAEFFRIGKGEWVSVEVGGLSDGRPGGELPSPGIKTILSQNLEKIVDFGVGPIAR